MGVLPSSWQSHSPGIYFSGAQGFGSTGNGRHSSAPSAAELGFISSSPQTREKDRQRSGVASLYLVMSTCLWMI